MINQTKKTPWNQTENSANYKYNFFLHIRLTPDNAEGDVGNNLSLLPPNISMNPIKCTVQR